MYSIVREDIAENREWILGFRNQGCRKGKVGDLNPLEKEVAGLIHSYIYTKAFQVIIHDDSNLSITNKAKSWSVLVSWLNNQPVSQCLPGSGLRPRDTCTGFRVFSYDPVVPSF